MKHPLASLLLAATLAPLALADEKLQLIASDAAHNDFFGTDVALSDSLAIIGSPYDDDNGESSGSVYVFDAATGQELAKIVPTEVEAGDRFGGAVAISGTMAIVGADGDDDLGDYSGAAYLIDLVTMQATHKLLPADFTYHFGESVAISGSTAVVGSPYDDDNGKSSGSAYLFDVTTGQQIAKLMPADIEKGDVFGSSVAIAGNTVIVGSPKDGDLVGSAYLFDATTGQELAKLESDDAEGGDQLGGAVAIRGQTAVVGARWKYFNNIRMGAAYLFDTGTGQQVTKYLPEDGLGGQRFGQTLAVEGSVVLIGSPGSLYRFDKLSGQQVMKILPGSAKETDGFGSSVSISGAVGLAGSPSDNTTQTNTGSAYVFDLIDVLGTNYCGPATVNSSGDSAAIAAYGTASAVDNCVELHGEGLAKNQSSMFLNSQAQAYFQPPGSQGFLCLGGGIGRYAKKVLNTSGHGYVVLELDLSKTPTPAGPVAVQPGDTWYFQLWFRDVNPTPTSNFTDGVSITFN